MSDDITRREFLKLAGALAASLSLPLAWQAATEAVTFTDVVIDDGLLTQAVRLGRMKREGGQAILEATLDHQKMWRAVSLVDDKGRCWTTEDSARTFHHGDMYFEWVA